MRRKLALAAALWLGVSAAQETVIRGGVQLVDLLVTVRDKNGALLKDLQQNQFNVFEDGRRQEIRNFSRETDLPLTIGVLVDISGSVAPKIPEERVAARKFFESVLRPQDQAFLISFGRQATLLQDTTSSLPRLLDGLDELQQDRIVSVPPSVINAQFPGGPRFPMPGPVPRRGKGTGGAVFFGGTVLYDAVFLAADEVLKPAAGRKAIIVITDGQDQGSHVSLARAVEAAQRSDVIVYSIQVRSAMGRVVEPLGRLSTETGGRVHRLEGKMEKIFAEIGEELRSQYSLSFSPVGGAGYHSIEVRMANKNFKAQTRKGYYGR